MPLNPESTFPSRRTYLLKVRSESDRNALENVFTGRQHELASDHDLIELIASDTEAGGGGPSVDANGNGTMDEASMKARRMIRSPGVRTFALAAALMGLTDCPSK